MSGDDSVRAALARITDLEDDARAILATHEGAASRIITLEGTYATLTGLSLDQEELFRESLRAVQQGLFRAAHVLAWAGFIDYLHNFFYAEHLPALRTARPKWSLSAAEDLREQSDFGVIEAGKAANVYGNTMMRGLQGLLSRRNECAHPSTYLPDLNMTLGYMSDLFDRIKRLQ
jgi:hypothetical protein